MSLTQRYNHDNEGMVGLIKTFLDGALMIALYIGGVLALNMPVETFSNPEYFLTVAGASLAGAIVLAYYRRELSYKELFFKIGCASILGVVCGSIITAYFSVVTTPYILGSYFFSSLLAIFLIRALLSVTEQNASGFVITVIQTLLRTRVADSQSVVPQTNSAAVLKTEIVVKPDSTDKSAED